jgi:hypothetical protein
MFDLFSSVFKSNSTYSSTCFFLIIPCIILIYLLMPVSQIYAQADHESLASELRSLIKHEPLSVLALKRSVVRYSYQDDQFNRGRTFGVDQLLIGIQGNLDDNFDYRIIASLAGQRSLLDAYITYTPHNLINIRAGALKPYLSAEYQPGPGATDFIDRSRMTRTKFNVRELGLRMFGRYKYFGYDIGVFNGTGLTANTDNRFLYTGRLEYLPLTGQNRSMRIGTNIAFGDCFSEECSPSDVQVSGRKVTWGGDFSYESDRWKFVTEALVTEAEITESDHDRETIFGAYVTGGYKPSSDTILLVRWDYLSYRNEGNADDLFLIGINHRPTSLIRFQINLLALVNQGTDNQFGLSANMQVNL